MNRRSGGPRRNESFVTSAREWISDNLRYIIIAAAAVIVALIVIFAVKASNAKKTADKTPEGAAVTVTPDASEWKKGTATTITVTPGAPDTSKNTGTAVSGYPSLDVPGTVITYLDAVAYGDVDTARAYSEDIDESTVEVIESGHPFSEFNSIYVYEYPGAKEGEYVAVTSFEYTERATGNIYPGVGAYYLVTGSDGIIRMASTKTTEANQKVIDEVVDTPEVQQILANINAAYEAAAAQYSGQPEDTGEGAGEAQPEETPGEIQEGGEEAQPEDTGEGGEAQPEGSEEETPEGEDEAQSGEGTEEAQEGDGSEGGEETQPEDSGDNGGE